MTTVGELLGQARRKKKISIRALSRTTRIKEGFLRAIEAGAWQNLPDFAVTAGFVRNFAQSVGVAADFAQALLRRDYPQRTESAKPLELKLEPRFWTPKTTLFVVTGLTVLILAGYLVRQYLIFTAAPPLQIFQPQQNQEVQGQEVEVRGRTSPQATVRVNNQPVLVDENGNFQTQVILGGDQTSIIIVRSESRGGKTTERQIQVLRK